MNPHHIISYKDIFTTLYLAPRDYHRVHMPYTGMLESITYIPGRLFSVNTKTADNIPDLFTRNERMICVFDTAIGKMAVVFVGAMIVGNIQTNWTNSAQVVHTKTIHTWHYDKTTFHC